MFMQMKCLDLHVFAGKVKSYVKTDNKLEPFYKMVIIRRLEYKMV